MAERYDQAAAAHYAAYRPALHAGILSRLFDSGACFDVGLDVGCGTGHSTVALADHCRRTYGVDPSASMLRQAVSDERVTYLRGAGDSVPLPDGCVDVVTFAGSLHYADSEATRAEVLRVCRASALVVVCDFELLLDQALSRRRIELPESDSDYDHRADFSGCAGFVERSVASEQAEVEMAADELAHVLLSDSNRLDYFAEVYQSGDPFTMLVEALVSTDGVYTVPATIHYALYSVGYT